ncbi:DUF4440 domain-containing protein [Christiangramia sabulilitoris]|uniref:Nuclear transport factor 2 family protein n=1 Tax=Christiangramia sabulilitoris TaxID=2583991 RepID=A0A550I2R0_9FLAO|nr:DUF4440 domain-containing protein [Christiangramia sabulilitoris]TRO65257.1 nuclear transport factor 2 family protein [Christiangramia sabulilitoris]
MKYFFLVIITILACGNISAQVSRDSELYQQLKARDSLLFDVGFNQCKIHEFEDFVSDDLEFYHDQGGLSTTKKDFLEAIRNNICNNPEKKPIRKLVEGSMEVYPLYENGKLYGAIQKAVHDFYIKEPKKELYKTSSAKFTHVWLLKNNTWILQRVLSYDHQNPD